jgi:hypothetical protein
VAQAVEHLPSKHNPSTIKKQTNKKPRRQEKRKKLLSFFYSLNIAKSQNIQIQI